MQEILEAKRYYYVDESGDPAILASGGRDLVAEGLASKVFMVGYVEIENPKELSRRLVDLRDELAQDEYLREVPSISSSLVAFHANKDCSEVRERVFKILRDAPYQAFVVVARKDERLFRKKFDLKTSRLYEYLVSKGRQYEESHRDGEGDFQGEMAKGQPERDPCFHPTGIAVADAAGRRLYAVGGQ
jgi:hypothetical protein